MPREQRSTESNRLESFSDGVFAIIITIMVLDLRPPQGHAFTDLFSLWPKFLSYVLSFVYLLIYWNNHHYLLKTMSFPHGWILWANAHLLFWLSLVPFTTAWLGESGGSAVPTALYGFSLLMAAIAYSLLQSAIIRTHGSGTVLKKAIGRDFKGKLSPTLYILAIEMGFVLPLISYFLFIAVALLWIVPDRRLVGEIGKN